MRSPSPSWAIPRSAWTARTVDERTARFSSSGSGSRPGKCPSACALMAITSHPICRRRNGVIVAVAPHAQSTTTRSFAVPTSFRIDSTCCSTRSGRDMTEPTWSQEGIGKLPRSSVSSISRCWSSSNAIPSGFHSLIPLYGAGLWDAVTTAPHANSRVPLASVGVETRPASIAGAPEDKTPAVSAWTSIGPVTRGSRPTIVLPYASPRIIPTRSARSGVTSTFPSPRIPDEPNRRTNRDTGRAIESLWRGSAASLKQPLYSDVRIATAREFERVPEGSDGHGTREHRGGHREGQEERTSARPGQGNGRDSIHERSEQPDRSHHLG